jgi:methionine--tRNA ligase beta chain
MPDSVPQAPAPLPAGLQPVASALSIDDFRRVQLVVGEIKEVAEHPNANKLLLLKVDLGGGQVRQLVAGIRGAYEAPQLLGRQVVVVANLAPATIRGQKSEGMLLAAEGPEGAPVLLGTDKPVAAGSKVR